MKLNDKQTKLLMIEGTFMALNAISFFAGFMAGRDLQTKALKRHEEITALQQDLINILGDGNREYKMTNDEFDKLVQDKIEFINLVYREAGFREI